MLVDPFLITALVLLLVVACASAAVFYVRYQRCEAVYEAYGRGRQSERVPEPTDERYVLGADFAAEPAPIAPTPVMPAPEPAAHQQEPPRPEIPQPAPEPPREPLPASPESADELFLAEPAAPGDSFFYEYTSSGFVPVDPYEPVPAPGPPPPEMRHPAGVQSVQESAAGVIEGDSFAISFAADEVDVREELDGVETETSAQMTEHPASQEEGFVWL